MEHTFILPERGVSNRSSESDTSTNSGLSLDSDTSSIETAEEEDSGGDEASDKIGLREVLSTGDVDELSQVRNVFMVMFLLEPVIAIPKPVV